MADRTDAPADHYPDCDDRRHGLSLQAHAAGSAALFSPFFKLFYNGLTPGEEHIQRVSRAFPTGPKSVGFAAGF